MKYHLTFNEKLKKLTVDERDIDRIFGQYIHSSLEKYYSLGQRDFISEWADFPELPPESKEFHKTRANGIKLLNEYINHYKAIDSEMEIVDVESVIKIPLTKDVTWVVKLDTVVRLRGNLYSLEHKTTKNLSPTYFNSYNPNTQISGQVLGIEHKYGQCSGVLVNVLLSGFRQKAYKGEPAGFHCKFQREVINRDASQLKDFKQNVVKWVDRMLEVKDNPEKVLKNENACHQYRGCQYKEICMTSVGTKLDEQVKEVLYGKVNPLEYLNGKEPIVEPVTE
jgi:hypothetical protein